MNRMNELARAVEAIENGLLKVSRSGESPATKMELTRRMKHYKVPGVSTALVSEEKLAWAKGFGLVEAGGEAPVTPETIFQAASISKPFTAMVALRLVEDGLLNLDADANDFLRSWKIPGSKYTRPGEDGKSHPVTLRGLLSHTAGMNIFGYPGYPAGSELPTLLQVLKGEPPAASKPVRVVQVPGTAFQYSGGGYLVAQQMIQDTSGRSLPALVKEFIFDRLGMSSSTFEMHLPGAWHARAATAHDKKGVPITGRWHTYPEQAAASLWTTSTDLARFIVEVLKSLRNESNRVLSAENTRLMMTPQIGLGGVGFNTIIRDGLTRFGHPGWNEGFHNMLLGCPERGQGLIWMTNGENGRRLGYEISRGVADVVGWTWW